MSKILLTAIGASVLLGYSGSLLQWSAAKSYDATVVSTRSDELRLSIHSNERMAWRLRREPSVSFDLGDGILKTSSPLAQDFQRGDCASVFYRSRSIGSFNQYELISVQPCRTR